MYINVYKDDEVEIILAKTPVAFEQNSENAWSIYMNDGNEHERKVEIVLTRDDVNWLVTKLQKEDLL